MGLCPALPGQGFAGVSKYPLQSESLGTKWCAWSCHEVKARTASSSLGESGSREAPQGVHALERSRGRPRRRNASAPWERCRAIHLQYSCTHHPPSSSGLDLEPPVGPPWTVGSVDRKTFAEQWTRRQISAVAPRAWLALTWVCRACQQGHSADGRSCTRKAVSSMVRRHFSHRPDPSAQAAHKPRVCVYSGPRLPSTMRPKAPDLLLPQLQLHWGAAKTLFIDLAHCPVSSSSCRLIDA